MGWLRTLMTGSEPRIGSYGELARRCLDQGQWPAGIRPKPRSLASLFSKFDREIELEWLGDRAQVQHAMAEVLGCPLSALQQVLSASLGRADHELKRWRLPDAPQARPLDLQEEELPPGLPPEACAPQQWGRVWWQCPSGGDAALVRRWLAARYKTRAVLASNWNDAEVQLGTPDDGPLFLQLQSSEGNAANIIDTTPRLLVACSEPPPDDSWRLLQSPPISAVLGELMEWLEERLPDDGQFDASFALNWLIDEVPRIALDSVGSALGLGALLDEVGVEKVKGLQLRTLAAAFVKRRLNAASMKGGAEAQWLRDNGFHALVGIAKRALIESALPWESPRDHDEWIALIPVEYQRNIDAEWAQVSLAQAGAPLTVTDLEQAISHLPPGAFRVVRALTGAQLLVHDSSDRLKISPQWLSRVLEEEAQESLLSEPALVWGEALLTSRSSLAMRGILSSRLKRGDTDALDAVLELEDSTNPAFVCALETMVELAGIALLQGLELSADQIEDLLEAQNRLIIRYDDRCSPRLGSSPTQAGLWRIAVWAISEQSSLNPRQIHPSLSPWGQVEAPLMHYFDSLLPTVNLLTPESWLPGAHAMLHRLAISHAHNKLIEHDICLPSTVMTDAQPSQLNRLSKLSQGIWTLQKLVEIDDQNWSKWCESAWRQWAQASFPSCDFFTQDAPWADEIWRAAPAECVTELIWLRSDSALGLRFSALSPDAWSSYLESTAHVPLSAWRMLPQATLHDALATALRLDDSAGVGSLWQRFPIGVLDVTLRLLSSEDWSSGILLIECMPTRYTASLLAPLQALVARSDIETPLCAFIRKWLHQEVLRRKPYWRDSYALLNALEQRFRRVAEAEG